MSVWSAVNYHLSNEMSTDTDYSLDEVEVFYKKIMNWSEFCELATVEKDTLRKRLEQWCEVDGGWMVKKGRGKSAKFCKVDTDCKYSKHHDKAMKLLAAGEAWWKRRRS